MPFFSSHHRCCSSYIGNVRCGEQGISLGSGCVYLPTVIHEIGHAIGFYHEQNRPDRDKYIKVLYENILPGMYTHYIILFMIINHSFIIQVLTINIASYLMMTLTLLVLDMTTTASCTIMTITLLVLLA